MRYDGLLRWRQGSDGLKHQIHKSKNPQKGYSRSKTKKFYAEEFSEDLRRLMG